MYHAKLKVDNFSKTCSMNSNDVRKQLHELIDKIEDDEQLIMLHEAAIMYSPVEVDDSEPTLSEEQIKKIASSIEQANVGNVIVHDTVMQMAKQWRTK